MQPGNQPNRIIATTGAVTGWIAVIMQLYLIIINRATPIPETIIRYLSFYTILTNILVAICLTVSLLAPASNWGRFFLRSSTVTAIGVYITVVGLVYNLVLRSLWQPHGMQQLVDELLHSFIPLLFIVYWFLSKPTTELKWKNALPWLLFPLIYLLYILLRGAFSGFYPYPFVNAQTLGYQQVALNCFLLFLTFLALSFGFIFIHKIIKEKIVQIGK